MVIAHAITISMSFYSFLKIARLYAALFIEMIDNDDDDDDDRQTEIDERERELLTRLKINSLIIC